MQVNILDFVIPRKFTNFKTVYEDVNFTHRQPRKLFSLNNLSGTEYSKQQILTVNTNFNGFKITEKQYQKIYPKHKNKFYN